MAIRCYIPTTLTALRSGLSDVRAVAPDEQSRSLRGEELEAAEFDAMCISAAIAADAAFEPVSGSEPTGAAPAPRVIVAYDAPESSPRDALAEGFDLIGIEAVDMDAVASFHLDEDEVWDEAVTLARESGRTEAEGRLGESDLLWYDASELEQLLDERA